MGKSHKLNFPESWIVSLYLEEIYWPSSSIKSKTEMIFEKTKVSEKGQPSFNVPNKWKNDFPKSIFFYKQIYAMDIDAWQKYLLGTSIDDLLDKAIKDLSYETHLIAEKIGAKVKMTKRGFDFYLVSVIFMLLMVVIIVILVLFIN